MITKWEKIEEAKDHSWGYGSTWRLKVPGGWIYRHQEYGPSEEPMHAMVFVPDPKASR